MEMNEDQKNEMFTIEVPDVKVCLHEMRVHPLAVEVDGITEHGFIARMVGHSADNQPMIIDFIATESVLQEAVARIVEAGMMSVLQRDR